MDNPEAITTLGIQVTGRSKKKVIIKNDEQQGITQKIKGWTHVITKNEQFLYDTHHVTNIVKYRDDI